MSIMLDAFHAKLKEYLGKDLVCPFGKISIKKGDTPFAENISLFELLYLNPASIRDKFIPYVNYLKTGDGMIINLKTDKNFQYGEATEQKTQALKKEVYKVMADTAATLSYVLFSGDRSKRTNYRKNEYYPAIASLETQGFDITDIDLSYKKIGSMIEAQNMTGKIAAVQFLFTEEDLMANLPNQFDSMMFYMGPEYHPKHDRYAPYANIVLTKAKAFVTADPTMRTVLENKVIKNREDNNFPKYTPSSFVNPDLQASHSDHIKAQEILTRFGLEHESQFEPEHFTILYEELLKKG